MAKSSVLGMDARTVRARLGLGTYEQNVVIGSGTATNQGMLITSTITNDSYASRKGNRLSLVLSESGIQLYDNTEAASVWNHNLRIETGTVSTSSSTGKGTVTFSKAFSSTPRIFLQAVAPNDSTVILTTKLLNPSATGFTALTYYTDTTAHLYGYTVNWLAVGQ